MPIDPRKLRPSECVRLLNSTPLGEVISERRLHLHRSRAGLRIGDGKTVDLLRYASWLVVERHKPKSEALDYEAQKERAQARSREMSRSARDIGELPAVADPVRRSRAERDFRIFCEAYFQSTFYLAWSGDHLRVIRLIEQVVLEGGLFGMAMPRGSGKTSLCEVGSLWAVLYGHRPFVAIVGPDESHAAGRVQNLRTELDCNDVLLADFPEVCLPIRRLEGINQRKLLYHGEQIRMEFSAKRIIFPEIPGSRASGAVVATAGITGQIRGMNYKREDGSVIRPSLVILDDPQTDESAHSLSQCEERARIINGAVLGLAGPGTKISAIMPCTVVRADDLADRMLNREKNPQWQGERLKMVRTWSKREDLWQKYAALRKQVQQKQGEVVATRECNAFYKKHKKAMDDGADVSWPARYNPDELSAIQSAWNIRIDRGDTAFFAEYQNEPLPEDRRDEDALKPDDVVKKLNGHARGGVPLGCTMLTMFVDVQQKALFWIVVAWGDGFTGHVVDYGTEPEQKTPYFSLKDIRHTLAVAAPRAGLEGAIYAGLERLVQRTLGHEWRRDDGAMMRIDRGLIDANWGESTDVIYQFCRQSAHASTLTPSHGKYVGAASKPLSEWQAKPGDRAGLNWRIPVVSGRRSVRHVIFDTNFWKSFIHSRLAVPMGDPGCLALFGRKPEDHRLLAEHLTSEFRVRTEGRGRTVYEWKVIPGRDNHWFDGVVGCAVAASMQGAALPGMQGPAPKKRRAYKDRYAKWASGKPAVA